MTTRLFNESSTIKQFLATVTSCKKYEDGKDYVVTLTKTAFFPNAGGQLADTGVLFLGDINEVSSNVKGNSIKISELKQRNDETDTVIKNVTQNLEFIEVRDVIETQGEIYHVISREIEVGQKITGILDWENRFSKMQQHTGEHIISGLVDKLYGYENVGFHLGEETVTMDYNGQLNRKQLDELETLAMIIIGGNQKIKILYPTIEELEKISYRSKMEIEGQVRVVQIPGCDSCACCAPHVERTGQVGLIKLLDVEKHRGGVRITMVCGDRALKDYQNKSNQVKEVCQQLSLKGNEVSLGVKKLNLEYQKAKLAVQKQGDMIVDLKLQLMKKDWNYKEENLVILFEEELTSEQAKTMVNKLMEMYTNKFIVLTPKEEGYQFITGQKDGDVTQISQLLRENLGAKGGGKPAMAQGSVNVAKEQILEVLKKSYKIL